MPASDYNQEKNLTCEFTRYRDIDRAYSVRVSVFAAYVAIDIHPIVNNFILCNLYMKNIPLNPKHRR